MNNQQQRWLSHSCVTHIADRLSPVATPYSSHRQLLLNHQELSRYGLNSWQ